MRNPFANNISTDIKLRKTQLSKKILKRGLLVALLDKFARPLMKVAPPLAKNVLTTLATMASCYLKKNAWKRCCISRKRNHFSNFE